MSTSTYDYIVIGSGFGGSVSAMRLTEKGYNVLVIEKGKRYEAKDFPKSDWDTRKFLWAPLLRCFGIQKLTFFKDVFIISGVGVGGGSLVYANTHFVPPDGFFRNPAWAKFKDWQQVLKPFYDTAKFMLGTTPIPQHNIEDELLAEVALDMGREETFGKVEVGVFFGDKDNETDPYFGGLGPHRSGCIGCAGCMVGCRYNAKNTLDKNYLWFAEKNGAVVLPETKVWKVEYIEGEYLVHTRSSTSFFRSKNKIFRSKGIVFSGGVLGTLDLLLKQKHQYKTLNRISEKLGENLLTNSESICGITHADRKLNHGVAISSVFNPDEITHVEIVKYPNGSGAMGSLAVLATDGGGPWFVRPIKFLGNLITNPGKVLKTLFQRKWPERSLIFLVMQSINNSMKMVWRRGLFGNSIRIENKGGLKVPAYIPVGQEVIKRYAAKVNGIPQNAITEIFLNMSTTAHILGGCPMGADASEGVVNDKFRVFGYPDMIIADGSIMPCNLGVNPSLTITALSEYAMSHVPEKPGNKKFPIEYQLLALKKD